MSVHNLGRDARQQLEKRNQSSSLKNVLEAEGNQPLEIQFNTEQEDGAFRQLHANNSRARKTKSLAEKGRKYEADILHEKRKGALSAEWKKRLKSLMIFFTLLVIEFLLQESLIKVPIGLS